LGTFLTDLPDDIEFVLCLAAEQNRLYTHIRELSSQIMKAGQDAPAAAWLRVACPDLMDTIQKLDLLTHYPQLTFYRRCWPDQA